MKRSMRLFPLVLILATLVSSTTLHAGDEDYLYDKDVQTLLRTAYFGFGQIGMMPNISEGEAALKRIMRKDDAMKRLIPVFEHGTPAGKCYALVGFRLLAPKYFESSSQRIAPWMDSKIKSVAGCIIGETTLADIVQAIREGRYDDEALGKQSG